MRSTRVRIERVVAGGYGLGREQSGRVVLAAGALPGELVDVRLDSDKRDVGRGPVETVVEPAAGRIEPPCRHVSRGCGGCDLQHGADALQRVVKLEIVRDALARLGRVTDPQVVAGPPLPTFGYRTTVRGMVRSGRFAFRRASRRSAVEIDSCMVAHPLLDELVRVGRFGRAEEVTLRASTSTGERLAVLTPSVQGVELPDGVTEVGDDELRRGRRVFLEETVLGRRYRIGARSFFQPGPAAARTIADTVATAAVGRLTRGGVLVDLYGGGGLLSGSVFDRLAAEGVAGVEGVLVERSRSSSDDAVHNLADLPVSVVRRAVEDWRPRPADVVVVDPSREGLAKSAARAVVACGAQRVVLVSCDAAAGGRDVGRLIDAGYLHQGSTVVDAFPQTHHVEVVTILDRPR